VIETDFDPPNPWLGYKACLQSISDTDCTHGVIIQDDTIPCHNLPRAVEKVAEAIPDHPVCLYLGMLPPQKGPALQAGKEGKCFVELVPRSFLPVVAVLWPKDKAEHFLHWSATHSSLVKGNGQRIQHRSDDAMGGQWMRTQRQRVFATIPSLVQHPDDVVSTIALRPAGRTALFWHPPPWDPLTVDWAL
jgi:hypothetical protein